MSPGGGENEEQFLLSIDTEGADQSLSQINAIQDALGSVDDQTQTLSASASGAALQFNSVADAAAALNLSADQIAAISGNMDALDASTQNVIRDVGDLGRDIQALPDPPTGAFEGDDTGGGGDSGGGGIGRGNIRGIQAGLRGVPGASDATSALRAVSYFGPAGAALVILGDAAKTLTTDAANAAKEVTAEADAIYQAQVRAAQQTHEQLVAQLANDTATRDAQNQADKDANSKFAQYVHDNLLLVNGEIETGTTGLNSTYTGLKQASDDQHAAAVLAQNAVDGDTAALKANATAGNDLKGVLQTLVNDGILVAKDAVQKLTDEQTSGAQAEISVQQMTQTQRAAKVTQDLEDQAVLAAELQQTGLTTAAHAKLKDQYDALTTEVTLLSGTTNTYADQQTQLAANTKAVSDQTTNYEAALADEGKIRGLITADTKELNDERSAAAAQQQTDYADEQTKLAQISTDGAQKQQQIAQDNAAAIAKINTQAGQDEQNAAGDRDANAYRLAEQKQQTDLTDQQANDKKQSDQANIQFAAQRATAQDNYNKELTQLQTSLASKEQVTDQHLAQDQVNLTNTLNNETQLAINGAGLQRVIHTQAWTDIATITANGLTDLENRFIGFFQRANAIAGLPITSNGNPNEQPLNVNIDNRVLQVLDNVLPSASNGMSGNRLIP